MILIIHRNYRLRGGEEVFLDSVLIPALGIRQHAFEVLRLPALFSKGYFFESLLEFIFMVLGFEKLRPSYRKAQRTLDRQRPTHVILNNFIPTVSLAVPALVRSRRINVISWVHNGRLSCANGLFFDGTQECHRCFTRGSHWAFLRRCHKTWIQSALYAVIYRNRRVAKIAGGQLNRFVATSLYTSKNIESVIKALDLHVPITLARSAPVKEVENRDAVLKPKRLAAVLEKADASFYLFVGRISFEKGADLFVDLAEKLPQLHFVLCGEGPDLEKMRRRQLENLFILGQVDGAEKKWLYQNAEALILTSRVPENAPMVIVESQSFGVPVVYPRGGGAEELVRVLGRAGCPIDEFTGQKFVRLTQTSLEEIQNAFEDQLENILASK